MGFTLRRRFLVALIFITEAFHMIKVCESDYLQQSRCECEGKQFACATTSNVPCTCIPIEWRCDSDNDCGDRSDEDGCVKKTCQKGHYSCANGMCILEEWICDGANDCGDDSDELNCPFKVCDQAKEMKCDSDECVAKSVWCDGEEDCEDGSDEKHCERPTCAQTDFACKNQQCIMAEWQCDKDFDCRDGSDEENCENPELVKIVLGVNVTCKEDEFSCGDFGECIRLEYRCDGDRDCSNGKDELLCETLCSEEQFRCLSGQCIPFLQRCDNSEDCGDGSDEADCPEIRIDSCMANEFQCTNGLCISEQWRCDDDQDCVDNSDEADCGFGMCGRDQFQCKASLRCIRYSWRCDGDPDCMDRSDELDCDLPCTDDQFTCGDGQCIGSHKLCNGHPDCRDRSDEPPVMACNSTSNYNQKRSTCSVNNGDCEHTCRETAQGAVCACRRGYKFAQDRTTCIDVNECLIESSCSQDCANTDGSYVCSCLDGYTLRHDGRTCKANGPEPSLLFANRIDIRRMPTSADELKPILRDLENAIALDYHINKDLMFWSDVTLDRIKSSFINGSNVKEIVTNGLESPGGIAVDWIHDLLYWTDSGTSRLEVAQLDGKFRKVLIWDKLEKPRAIALHPQKSLMFWTDWGVSPRVESAWMDGNGRKTIASTNMYWPNGLTVDYTRNHVYWVDARHHIIERANTDGQNRKAVISRGLPHPFSITLFEDKLYWTDWHTKSINTANKFTGNSRRTILNKLHFPMGIQTYHPQRQPKGESKCSSNQCNQLCLPNPNGHTCACQTGFKLINRTHCAEEIDEFLIFVRKSEIRRISYDADNHSDTVLPLKKLKSAVAVDWDSEYPGFIYWSDVGSDTINRAHWDGNHQQEIVSTNLDSPAGIAVDWISRKLYWTDAGMNRIEVSMLDGSMRCVIIWTDLDRPRDILVFPAEGQLFWSDWGSVPKIERSSMDGSKRISIVTQGLESPNGLALDFPMKRLYWADGGKNAIESCNLDGSLRRLITADNLPHPFGLALHNDRIYWTDWSLDMIQSADKNTGKDHKIMRQKLGYLMDIHYYHKNRPISRNPCDDRNGNCSHLCLLAEAESGSRVSPGFSCACPTGLALGADGKTCNSVMNRFLVMARRTDIRVISLDVEYSADVKLPIVSNLVNVIDVAVDPIEGYLYWSDIGSRQVSRAKMVSLEKSEIVLGAGLGKVDGLVIDVLERKLYWTDSDRGMIGVSELNGTSAKTLVHKNLDLPRAITLHHRSGYLYWSDWGKSPKIERVGMDGNQRSEIITTNLVWPNGLTVDNEQSLLVWADAHTELIECSSLKGENRRTLRVSVEHPYSLTAMDGFLYWTDWQTRNVERLDLRNTSEFETVRKNLPNIMGIKAVHANRTEAIRLSHKNKVCKNNGGCSHLCLRSPGSETGYRCACPTGILIGEDGKTCDFTPSRFLLFTSRNTVRRLSLDTDANIYVQLPIPGLENVIAVDYHFEKQTLYFTDVYEDVIRSANMDGTGAKTVVEGGLRTMDGVAVDWIANHLYWTDTGANSISVAWIDGTKRKKLIEHGLDEPRAIALHPVMGLLFWTDWGAKARIESAYLDGSNRKVIVSTQIVWPNGLTIDSVGDGRIFWVDAHASLQRIESCNFNGENRRVVVERVLHGFSLTYLDEKLYWTDWQTHAIEATSLSGDSATNRTKLVGGIVGLMDVKAVSPQRQLGTNECDARKKYGDCGEGLCLMRGQSGHRCVAPDYVAPPTDKTVVKPATLPAANTSLPNHITPTNYTTITTSVSSTTMPGVKGKDTTSLSYLLGMVFGLLVVVISVIVFIAILMRRCMRSKHSQPHIPRLSTKVSFRNPGYSTYSQHTLLTSEGRSSPRTSRRLTAKKNNADEFSQATARVPPKEIEEELLAGGGTSPPRDSRNSTTDFCALTDDNDHPLLGNFRDTDCDDLSLSSAEIHYDDAQSANLPYNLFQENRLSRNNDDSFRRKHEKQPKVSTVTAVTRLSTESESDTQPTFRPSSTTSSSRVSTPEILNNFDSGHSDVVQLNEQGGALFTRIVSENDLEGRSDPMNSPFDGDQDVFV